MYQKGKFENVAFENEGVTRMFILMVQPLAVMLPFIFIPTKFVFFRGKPVSRIADISALMISIGFLTGYNIGNLLFLVKNLA